MSSAEKFMPTYKPKKPVRCVETVLNRNTLVDLVAVYLQGISLIHDCEEVTDIEFGTVSDGIVPIKIYFKKGGKTK